MASLRDILLVSVINMSSGGLIIFQIYSQIAPNLFRQHHGHGIGM